MSGGAFIPTDEAFDLREKVGVHLSLEFCDQSLLLCGEVVHHVDEKMASTGATPGVAVQLYGTALELRLQMDPLVNASGSFQCAPAELGNRESQRVSASVLARIDAGDVSVTGHTRDLSQSGVLVDVFGEAIPIGRRVSVTLRHPISGKTQAFPGEIARQIVSRGEIAAVAIRFDPLVQGARELQGFIEDLQQVEHSRRLGGIHGSLAELSPPALLSMFGGTANEGTLTLRRGDEEQGVIGFVGGLLCYAHLGAASGMKALVRLLQWTEGTFEFHASLERLDSMRNAIPLSAAIIDAARHMDEGARVDSGAFPPDARPRLGGAADDPDALTKVESAVLDLVRAGFAIERIIEVIPEPDPEIYCALESLVEQGAITLS